MEKLEECLVHDVRPIIFGSGLDIVMNYVWGDDGVRKDVLETPHLVTLRMLGVDHLRFVGDLSESMKDDPGRIGWGLSEVAHVVPVSAPSGLGIAVECFHCPDLLIVKQGGLPSMTEVLNAVVVSDEYREVLERVDILE